MIIKIHKEKLRIDLIMVCVLLNVNVIRFFMNINSSSWIFDFLYIICALTLLKNNREGVIGSSNQKILIICTLIILYALISCLWNGFENIVSVLKLFICFFLLIMVYSFDKNEIKKIIQYSLILNAFYCIVILIFPDRISSFMSNGEMNYLTVTLSIGMVMTISMTYLICNTFSDLKIKKFIPWVVLGGLFFNSILQFVARGPIILPIISVLIVSLCIASKRKKNIIIGLVILFIIGYFGYSYYTKHFSSYGFNRMKRMFNNAYEEDRITIWKDSLQLIFKRGWFFLGGGVNGMKKNLGFYPHNYYIQMIGEYGVIGITLCVYLTFMLMAKLIRFNNSFGSNCMTDDIILTYVVFSATIYMLLTFCKSFSIYDAYPLYILLALSLKMFDELLTGMELKVDDHLLI